MRKQREYVAVLDNGRDYSEMEFSSYGRSGSKENIEDCKAKQNLLYGYKKDIVQIYRGNLGE